MAPQLKQVAGSKIKEDDLHLYSRNAKTFSLCQKQPHQLVEGYTGVFRCIYMFKPVYMSVRAYMCVCICTLVIRWLYTLHIGRVSGDNCNSSGVTGEDKVRVIDLQNTQPDLGENNPHISGSLFR